MFLIHVHGCRFGKGYYNGFGGKVEKGETIDQAAAREVKFPTNSYVLFVCTILTSKILMSGISSISEKKFVSCLLKQLQEESGVTATDMEKRGILTFHFDNDPLAWEVSFRTLVPLFVSRLR